VVVGAALRLPARPPPPQPPPPRRPRLPRTPDPQVTDAPGRQLQGGLPPLGPEPPGEQRPPRLALPPGGVCTDDLKDPPGGREGGRVGRGRREDGDDAVRQRGAISLAPRDSSPLLTWILLMARRLHRSAQASSALPAFRRPNRLRNPARRRRLRRRLRRRDSRLSASAPTHPVSQRDASAARAWASAQAVRLRLAESSSALSRHPDTPRASRRRLHRSPTCVLLRLASSVRARQAPAHALRQDASTRRSRRMPRDSLSSTLLCRLETADLKALWPRWRRERCLEEGTERERCLEEGLVPGRGNGEVGVKIVGDASACGWEMLAHVGVHCTEGGGGGGMDASMQFDNQATSSSTPSVSPSCV